jgi:hypothetical protein
MAKVYDSKGNFVGNQHGQFVYDDLGERVYWIDEDGDVFVRLSHECTELSLEGAWSLGAVERTKAISLEGEVILQRA